MVTISKNPKKKVSRRKKKTSPFSNFLSHIASAIHDRFVTVLVTAIVSIIGTTTAFYSVLFTLPTQVIALQNSVSELKDFANKQVIFEEKQLVINEKITKVEGTVEKIYEILIKK